MSPPAPPSSLPSTAGPGQARPRGPRTLLPSPSHAAAARGSPPASTVPRPWPGLPGMALPAPSLARHRPSLAPCLLAPASILYPPPGCLMAAGPLPLTGPALAAASPAPGGQWLLLGVTRVPQGGQCGGSLGCQCSGWAVWGRGSSALSPPVLCPTRAEPTPQHGIPLPRRPRHPRGLPASLAWPAASRLPATSEGLSASTRAPQQQ